MLTRYLQGLFGDRKNNRDEGLATYAYNPALEPQEDEYNEAWVKQWLNATAAPPPPPPSPPHSNPKHWETSSHSPRHFHRSRLRPRHCPNPL